MAVVSNTCKGTYGSDCKVYLEYKINSQNVTTNKSNITLHLYAQATSTSVGAYNNNGNCKAYIKIDGTTKKSSTSLSMDFRNKKKVEMLTWTGDVTHTTDGRLTITISGNFDTNGPSSVTTGSVSKTWTLTTIPRASSVTCANGNIGEETTININRASNSFTHTVSYNFLGLTGTITTKSSLVSIKWLIPTTFYTKIPNAKSGQGTITCQTYSGTTLIGTTTCNFNAFVTKSNPTITGTAVDVNEITVALTGDNHKLIKYFSNAQVDLVATAKNGATIKSQKVVCGNKTGNSSNNLLEGVESDTFTISCTDSRGLYGNNTIKKELIEYIKLAFVDVTMYRPTTTSNTINVKMKGNYYNESFGAQNNTLNLKYRYRQTGTEWTEEYISLTPVVTDNTFSYEASLNDEFDFRNEYEFEMIVTDKLMTIVTNKIVSRGIPVIDIGKEDVKVNRQIYMGENKVLSFVSSNGNEGYLADEEGNKHYPEINVINNLTNTSTTAALSANQGKVLDNKISRVGNVVITATNSNPGAVLGGTWTLIDKELTPTSTYTTSGSTYFKAGNVSSFNCMFCVAGHNLLIILQFNPKSNMADSDFNIGTIQLAALGVNRLPHTLRACGYTDGGNCMFMGSLNYSTGVVTSHDIIPDPYIASGQSCYITFTAPIHHSYMVDGKCNKFYWRRTA